MFKSFRSSDWDLFSPPDARECDITREVVRGREWIVIAGCVSTRLNFPRFFGLYFFRSPFLLFSFLSFRFFLSLSLVELSVCLTSTSTKIFGLLSLFFVSSYCLCVSQRPPPPLPIHARTHRMWGALAPPAPNAAGTSPAESPPATTAAEYIEDPIEGLAQLVYMFVAVGVSLDSCTQR
jgi:hypothetical protein